jgi:hypothetical protein
MEYERIDLITLFDLEFHHDRVSRADMHTLQNAAGNPALDEVYGESRNWIFDREPIPSLQRFCFPPSQRLGNSKGSSIIVSPEYGAGVFSAWQTNTDGTDPLKVKQRAWDSGEPYQELVSLGLGIEENDREYPFVAIQVRTDDLDKFCQGDSADLGRVFTGNYEYEEAKYLEEYVSAKNNISRRNYERLYIRWTEALAVYSNTVDKDLYEKPSSEPFNYSRLVLFSGDSLTTWTSEWIRFHPLWPFTVRALGRFSKFFSRSRTFSGNLLTRHPSGRWRHAASWQLRTDASVLTTCSTRQIAAAI